MSLYRVPVLLDNGQRWAPLIEAETKPHTRHRATVLVIGRHHVTEAGPARLVVKSRRTEP